MADNKSKKKIIIISVVAVILIAAIALGVIFLPGVSEKDTGKEEKTTASSQVEEDNKNTITLTDEDKELFKATNSLFFGYIFMNDYSYRATNAPEMAYNMLASNESRLYGLYFDESEVTYGMSDPKGLYTEQGYICFPADNFDFMLENILNLTPNREEPPAGYYYDGYYYACAPGGFGSGLWMKDFKFELIKDDKFKITVTVFDEYAESDESSTFYSTYYAQLKEVDGKKMWSVHTFDIFDESVTG